MKDMTYVKVLFAVFIVIIALVAIKIINDPIAPAKPIIDKQKEDERVNEEIKYIAYKRAVFMIKDNLKAPSTAKFPDYFDHDNKTSIYKLDSLITIRSYVDSQNSFGATLRADYTVKMTYINGKWDLVEVIFDNQKIY
ncbi:MAG: hypothetical protein Q8O72_10530 [Bacteroidales bacterium]|nr:hypothetical protein [Bacteroidales bacterium]